MRRVLPWAVAVAGMAVLVLVIWGAVSGAATDAEDAPLSRAPAWRLFGLGIGQTEIIFAGVATSTAIVWAYRRATRGNRHGA